MNSGNVDLTRIRQYIQQKMDEKGITRNEMAKRSKVARGTVDHFFDGSTVSPAFDRVCLMIMAVGGSVDEALGMEREKEYVMIPSSGEGKAETVDAYERLIRAKNAHMQELESQNEKLIRNQSEHMAEMESQNERLLQAKEAHRLELEQQNKQLREENRRLVRWQRMFIIENVLIALVTIADMMIPTFGYFRGKMESMMYPSSRLWG